MGQFSSINQKQNNQQLMKFIWTKIHQQKCEWIRHYNAIFWYVASVEQQNCLESQLLFGIDGFVDLYQMIYWTGHFMLMSRLLVYDCPHFWLHNYTGCNFGTENSYWDWVRLKWDHNWAGQPGQVEQISLIPWLKILISIVTKISFYPRFAVFFTTRLHSLLALP